MGLSRTVYETDSEFSRKSNFSRPRVFNAPAEGVPVGIVYRHRGQKLEWWGYQKVEKALT